MDWDRADSLTDWDRADGPMDWDRAEAFLDDTIREYQGLGWIGQYGLAVVGPLKDDVCHGRLSRELYEDIMALM